MHVRPLQKLVAGVLLTSLCPKKLAQELILKAPPKLVKSKIGSGLVESTQPHTFKAELLPLGRQYHEAMFYRPWADARPLPFPMA